MIFISIIISPSIFILHILLCNLFYKSEKKILFMFLSFKLYILIFFILITFFGYYQFNLEFISSLSIIIFMCLGYMEFFSMICRGFSLRILTDIYLNNDVTSKNIVLKYADNRGIKWLFEKRIQSIKKLNIITIDHDKIFIKYYKGLFIAYFCLFLKKIFLFDKSGE